MKQTKKQRVLVTVKDWITESSKTVPSNHYLTRLKELYGVDLETQLIKMTYSQLSVLLCCMVACNAKAHDDQRKWRQTHKERCAELAIKDGVA